MIFHVPRHAIDRLLLAVFLLLWPPFILLVTRHSGSTDVFGRWSWRYFIVVLVYCGGMLVAGFVAFLILRAGNGRLRVFAVLGWLHRQRKMYWLACILPPCLWLLVVTAIVVIGVIATPAIVVCLIDAALMVACSEVILALIGQTKKRQRELVLKFMLAGFATVLTMAAIEIGAAVLGLGRFTSWNINPKKIDVSFRTDDFDVQVVTNKQGLREPTLISSRHPDRQRIVVIGDSMTFGWGVEYEQAYAKVAERALHDTWNRTDLELINMGRPGAGPHDYLRYLRRYAVDLQPDLIVVGFLVGNDCPVIPPARLSDEAAVQNALADHVAAAGRSWLDRIVMKSFIVRLCYGGINFSISTSNQSSGKPGPIFHEPNPLDPALMEQDIASSDDPAGARQRYQKLQQEGWVDRGLTWRMNPWLVRAIILHPAGAADSLAVRAESLQTMQHEWQLSAGLLREMKVTADEMQIPLVVLAIPNAHLVSPRWVDFLQERGCIVTEDMTSSRVVNDWLAEFCSAEGILCIDPLDAFRARQAAGQDLYLQTDDHMTPAGYALLGESLASALASQLRSAKAQP